MNASSLLLEEATEAPALPSPVAASSRGWSSSSTTAVVVVVAKASSRARRRGERDDASPLINVKAVVVTTPTGAAVECHVGAIGSARHNNLVEREEPVGAHGGHGVVVVVVVWEEGEDWSTIATRAPIRLLLLEWWRTMLLTVTARTPAGDGKSASRPSRDGCGP